MDRRLGLHLLSDSFFKLQQRSFFKKVKQSKYYSLTATEHLQAFNESKLVECAFKSLKRYTKRKDYANMRKGQVEEL